MKKIKRKIKFGIAELSIIRTDMAMNLQSSVCSGNMNQDICSMEPENFALPKKEVVLRQSIFSKINFLRQQAI